MIFDQARSPGTTIQVLLAWLLAVLSSFVLPLDATAQPNEQELLEQAGRAFIEAEAESYIQKFLNQTPPIAGMEGFGSKALFAVQLVVAADAYLKADTDRERFAAVRNGAAAYVAYAYAATPAVGLAVTAVVLATQVIEAGVSASYAEAMLNIVKEIQQIELRIQDLNARLGEATALHFMMTLNEWERIIADIATVDNELRLDCRKPAGTFETLSSCLALLVQSLTLREQHLSILDRIISAPEIMLALLEHLQSLTESPQSGDNAPEKIFDLENVNTLAAAAKARFQKLREGSRGQLGQLEQVYGSFVKTYDKLAVQYIFDEALTEQQRLAAVEEIHHRCRLDRLRLIDSVVALSLRGVRLNASRDSDAVNVMKEARETGSQVSALLANYAQRTISCPNVQSDEDLQKQMQMLRAYMPRLTR